MTSNDQTTASGSEESTEDTTAEDFMLIGGALVGLISATFALGHGSAKAILSDLEDPAPDEWARHLVRDYLRWASGDKGARERIENFMARRNLGCFRMVDGQVLLDFRFVFDRMGGIPVDGTSNAPKPTPDTPST